MIKRAGKVVDFKLSTFSQKATFYGWELEHINNYVDSYWMISL